MQNKDNDATKIILGAIIGGIIGGGALYILNAARNGNESLLGKMQRTLSDLEDALGESRVKDTDEAIDDIEDTIPRGQNVISDALTLIATGINLWNKFKR